MASSGLQRRRAAGASTTEDEDMGGSRTFTSNGSASERDSSSATNGNGTVHAGTAFEGGSKIAVDMRDIEQDSADIRASGGRMPRLTLMEEVLLLGLKDKQGYLSFWNDNISYVLRGCILMELALRRRICISRDPLRKRFSLSERIVDVIDQRPTGETLLDEALRLMASTSLPQDGSGAEPEKMSVNTWIDVLSGETWNVLKIGYQLKQVRERLAKGLVDKGVLRTEKRNFLLFDMATHPVADARTKESIVRRCTSLLTAQTRTVPAESLGKEGEQCRATRTMALVSSAFAASVLENAFTRLDFEAREAAYVKAEELLSEFAVWPFGSSSGTTSTSSRRKQGSRIGTGSSSITSPDRESILGLVDSVRTEMHTSGPGTAEGDDLCFELIASVLDVLSRLDSLL